MLYTVTVEQWEVKELIWGDQYATEEEAVEQARELANTVFRAPTLAMPQRREYFYKAVRVYRADTQYGYGTQLHRWVSPERYFTLRRPVLREAV